MTRKLLILAAVGTISAFAVPVNQFNTRPAIVGYSPTSEASLQQILNNIFSGGPIPNANTDQSSAAMWQETGSGTQVAAPVIQATYTSAGDAVGIFSGTDSSSLTLLDIFTSSATTGTTALITFNPDGTVSILGGAGVNNVTNFSGINRGDFGFWLSPGAGTTYYSADNLNAPTAPSGNPVNLSGGQAFPAGYTTDARVLAYNQGTTNKWALAFEDGTDFDYNDRVISVESIIPVPEPASVVLFGSLLILCATGLRRRLATKA